MFALLLFVILSVVKRLSCMSKHFSGKSCYKNSFISYATKDILFKISGSAALCFLVSVLRIRVRSVPHHFTRSAVPCPKVLVPTPLVASSSHRWFMLMFGRWWYDGRQPGVCPGLAYRILRHIQPVRYYGLAYRIPVLSQLQMVCYPGLAHRILPYATFRRHVILAWHTAYYATFRRYVILAWHTAYYVTFRRYVILAWHTAYYATFRRYVILAWHTAYYVSFRQYVILAWHTTSHSDYMVL